MPISYLFRDDLLMLKAQGEATVGDFYKAWEIARTDPHFHIPLNMLIDLRDAYVDVPGQELERVVYDLKGKQFFDKMAFVADRGSFTYAMGRMFCINADSTGFCSDIFLNMADALSWLSGGSPDIPADDKGNP